ncbi:RNA ligase family protein [Chryseolinea lacunae]|uniref:RNA ligase family protein n=1 Tax=Chryseolinea lacunae TaxID=2801331 RepID=A0ABS1KRG6_9BACT|nr:RNA ligase family protein [Chryseolinea lacunae]MBL0742036.1 RNA ligase family protein [Chryseolinea lacunae]
MSVSRKYGRTYHYPFSPGTTSDDRINADYWSDVLRMKQIVHTEKLDGENNCLSRYGVFARSHAAPTVSAWTKAIRQHWESIKNDLGDVEIFGENLYAIHSIEYRKLEHHYYVFAVRQHDMWLGWDEVKFYAGLFDFPTVPEIKTATPEREEQLRDEVLTLARQHSVLESYDIRTNEPCTREGIVTRNTEAYPVNDLAHHVFKYVRKGHVKTDEHWTRHWRRAKLVWEFSHH